MLYLFCFLLHVHNILTLTCIIVSLKPIFKTEMKIASYYYFKHKSLEKKYEKFNGR